MELSEFDVKESIIEECQKSIILAGKLMHEESVHMLIQGIAENALRRTGQICKICQAKESDSHSGENDMTEENIAMLDVEITEILLLLKKLNYNQIEGTIVSILEQCKEYVNQAKADIANLIEETQFDLFDELEQCITAPHPGKVRKIVNENAEGDTFVAEVLMLEIGETIFKKKCGDAQDQLKNQIEVLFCKEDAGEKLCMTAIMEQIDNKYTEYCFKNRHHFRDCISGCLNDSKIWSRLQSRWGGGNGYSKEIFEKIKKELDKTIESKLGQENYYMDYVEDIEAFLNF